jgi:hypothetical protein
MLAMTGLRAFSLAAKRGSEGVSCDAGGVFVGGIPLLQPPSIGTPYWTARAAAELNKELSARYRLPIEIASKSGALALIAAALNRGDMAMAAIAAVQMQIPDPPPLTKRAETPDEITGRARELFRSGLLKFWDPAKHPRAGVPPNAGWFTLVGEKPKTLEVIPDLSTGNSTQKPWDEESETEGGGGEIGPPGVLELPLPGGSPGTLGPAASPIRPPAPERPPRGSWTLPDPKSKLPFMGETEPQLAPYVEGGPTSGIFRAPNLPPVELQSGYYGPTLNRSADSEDFNIVTMTHVEGHAAELMRQWGLSEAWLSINNPNICDDCVEYLEPKMLPPGATLHVVLPNGHDIPFKGRER